MSHIIKGKLCGRLCEDCTESLANVEVAIYLPAKEREVIAAVVANPKETVHIVSDKEKKARQKLLLGTTKTDEYGAFSFELDDKRANSALDIDVIVNDVPHSHAPEKHQKSVQIHLTTLYPQWREDNQGHAFYRWDYCIHHRLWCLIRGYYFDAWVICGTLVNCETGTPIPNAQVTAWDADFLSDDNLGTTTTDAQGHFRIDYHSLQFKQTFLSPWINVETDPGWPPTFQSGPDVYFKATLGGTTIIDETASDRRDNVGYCLCVKLCSDKVIPSDGADIPSAWTSIGLHFNIPTGPVLNDFDSEGFAGSKKFGFTGNIRLTGQAPHKVANGNRVEYRFLVSDVTTPNGGAAPALANFANIIGVTPGLFTPSLVAKIRRNTFPFPVLNVISDQADFDSNGWFDVNNAIERTLTNNGIPLSQLSQWDYIDEDTLLTLNTAALTTAPDVPNNAATAGNPVPPANRIGIEKVAVRFEIREVINKAANIFAIIPGSGHTLNSMVVNNNPAFMKIVLNELESLGSCTPINGTIHTAYTVHHPLLEDVSIHVHNNSNSVNKNLNDGFVTLSNNTNAAVNHHNNPSLQINATPNDLVRCTYELRLRVQRRLHTGDSQVSHNDSAILFFYDI